MTTTRELPLANYPTGSRTFVKQTPNGLAGFKIDIARCTSADPTIWPDAATKLGLFVTPSYDGGATFDPAARIGWGPDAGPGAGGGIRLDGRSGAEIVVQDLGGTFDPPANAVRVDVEIVNGPLRTVVDVTVL